MATLKQNSEALRAITDKLKSLPKKNELVELEVTENGEYTPPEGVDGYSKVTVATENRLAKYFNKTLTSITEADQFSARTEIHTNEFKGFVDLESVSGMQNINTIGNQAFRNCTKLRDIQLLNPNLTKIPDYCFTGCTSLKSLKLAEQNGITTIGTHAFSELSIDDTLLFPSVNSVAAYAFWKSNIPKLRFDSAVTSTNYSFTPSEELKAREDTGVYTDNLAEFLKSRASVQSYEREAGTSPLMGRKYLYVNDEKVTDLAVPEAVTVLNLFCLAGLHANSVRFHEAFTAIYSRVFQDADVNEIVFPASIRYLGASSMGDYAYLFYKARIGKIDASACDLVTFIPSYWANFATVDEILLPQNITTIGKHAFYRTKNITTLTIPASVTTFQDSLFGESSDTNSYRSISHIIMKGTTPPSITTKSLYSIKTISVPIGAGDTYKAATNWSTYASIIVESEEAGGVSGNWLFQNEQIGGFTMTGLPAPIIGVSYTCFVDGEEIATATCTENWNGTPLLSCYTEDFRVYFLYDATAGDADWYFHPVDSQVQSGSVSIRENANWLFKDERFEGGAPLNSNLPVPVEGVSYTLFIDGVEIGTGNAFYDEPEGCTTFWVNDGDAHSIVYTHESWSGQPDGSFSLRIND